MHPRNSSHNFPSRLLRFWTIWYTFTRFNPLFSSFTWFRSIVVHPCFIYRHTSTQKLFRIDVKIGQILLRSDHTNAFLVDCEKSRHPSYTELSHTQSRKSLTSHKLLKNATSRKFVWRFVVDLEAIKQPVLVAKCNKQWIFINKWKNQLFMITCTP